MKYELYDCVPSKDGVALWVKSDRGMQRLRGNGTTLEDALSNALSITTPLEVNLYKDTVWHASVQLEKDVVGTYSHSYICCAIAGAFVSYYNTLHADDLLDE